MDMVRADHTAPPTRPVGGMGDHPSGAALYGAIATALYRRERTGRGGVVSTSLMANGLWANGLQVQGHLSGVRYPLRLPREQAGNPLSNIYRTADDRWLSLVVLNEARQWPALIGALDLAHLGSDPRFESTAARAGHTEALIAAFDAAFAQRPLADWRLRLDAAGITFGVVGTLDDITHDAQMQASGAILPWAHQPGHTVATPITLHGAARIPPGRRTRAGGTQRPGAARGGLQHRPDPAVHRPRRGAGSLATARPATTRKECPMSYANGRLIHDADSHLMELDDCLDPYFEAALLTRYHQSTGYQKHLQRNLRPGRSHEAHSDPVFRAGVDDNLLLRKNYEAHGAFIRADRPHVVDLLGFASQLVFTTFCLGNFGFDQGEDMALAYAGRRRAQPHDDRLLRGRCPPAGHRLCAAGRL